MSDASAIKDELKILQHEVAELQENRKAKEAEKVMESGELQASLPDDALKQESADENKTDQLENGHHEIIDQLDIYLKELEDAALERPALALIVTFAVGIIVGQIISRR